MKDISDSFIQDVESRTSDTKYITVLPQNGMKNEELFEMLNKNLNLGNYTIFSNSN